MTHGATFFSAVSGAPWEDVAPLASVLEVPLSPEAATVTPEHSRALWKKLSYLGSNDLAYLLRGFEGVDYPEIVRDVCKQLKILEFETGEGERVIELNEQLVLGAIFADAWEHLDPDQRRELLRELNLDEGHVPLAGAAVAAAVLAGKAGPFAIYKLSLIVANSVARALPARRLAPARRKVVQAVVLVASLRQAQRTALAETALADAEVPGENPTARPVRPKKGKRPARKQVAERAPAAKQRAKKRRAPERLATQKSGAKKAASKKTVAKKKTVKKAVTKKTVAKKKRSRSGPP